MKRRESLKVLCTLPLMALSDKIDAQGKTRISGNSQEKAKNLIFISADGMGSCQWQAPGIRRKTPLSVMDMPYCCMVDTLPLDKINGDAPSHITAIATGKATKSGFVGLDADGKSVRNLMEYAKQWGLARGIVSANSLVEGSIVPFVAHTRNRMQIEAITASYVDEEFEVILGAGKDYFTSKVASAGGPAQGQQGRPQPAVTKPEPREDGRDLLSELKEKGYEVKDDLQDILSSKSRKLCGFTAAQNLPNLVNGRNESLFTDLTRKALSVLSSYQNGFMLMIGDMYVDRASHDGDLDLLCREALNLDEVVKVALDFAQKDQDTLVIVVGTPEASGMTLTNGNPSEGTVEAKWNEPGMIHTGIMVPCFTQGPGSGLFQGSYKNHELFPVILEAMGKNV